MAITAFTGLPGSGKSFRVVGDMLAAAKTFLIVHNIEGLQLSAFPRGAELRTFDQVAASLGVSVEDLFTLPCQERLAASVKEQYDRAVLVVVDEAQNVFSKATPETLEWLTKHRHLDQTVWLVTQNLRNIHRAFQRLVELEIRAKKGAVFPWFMYVHRSEGERIGFSRRSKNRAVFGAYKSFEHGTGKQVAKSKLLLWFFLFVVGSVGFYYYMTNGGLFASLVEEGATTTQTVAPPGRGRPGGGRHSAGDLRQVEGEATPDPLERERVALVSQYRFAGRLCRSGPLLYDGRGLQRLDSVIPGGSVLHMSKGKRELRVIHPRLGLVVFRSGRLHLVDPGQRQGVFGDDPVPVQRVSTEWWVWEDGPTPGEGA